MNRFELPKSGEAKLRYLDGDFRIITRGSFVKCAVTGENIPLDQLRYWSVDHQEAYSSAAVAAQRHAQRLASE